MRALALGVLLALSVGCSRKSEPPKPDAVAVRPKTELSTKIALRASWALHLDARKLRETAAIDTYRPIAVLPPVSQVLLRYGTRCAPLVDSFDELVASGRESAWVIAAHTSVPLDRALACVREVDGATAVTFHGRPALEFSYGEKVAMAIDDVLLIGERGLVGELVVLAFGQAAPPPNGPGLTLAADEVLSVRVASTGMVRSLEASLVAVPKERGEAITLTAKVGTGDDHSARTLVAALEPLRAQAESSKLLDFVLSVDAAAPSASLRVASTKDATTAARIAAAASIALGSALLRLDKTTEARRTIELVARRLADVVAQPTSGKRLLPSTGPLPSVVPPAQRVSMPALPTAWTRFDGLLPRQTFYQFEVVTTPDAKHAVVHARGDLDGDGTLSHFTLPVDVTASGYAVIGALSIDDALE